MEKLSGKSAFITGGTSGIGEFTAKALATNGAKVAVAGRDEEDGKRIVEEIQQAGGEAIFVQLDITDKESIGKSVQQTMDSFGTIDILFNGAGIHDSYDTVLDTDEKSYDLLMDINVKGPFLMTKEVLPMMLKKGKGTIINVSSIAGKKAFPDHVAYCATKFAVHGLSEALREEVSGTGM